MYSSNYGYNMIDRGLEGFIAGLGVFAVILAIFAIPILVLFIMGAVKTYKKAGKQGWEAIVPFYNSWIYVEIAGLNSWWVAVVLAYTIATVFSNFYFLFKFKNIYLLYLL